MSVRVMESSRQLDQGAHLAKVGALPQAEIEAIGRLARQLDGVPILPVVGAGASFDCGIRVAAEISKELFAAYEKSGDYSPIDEELGCEDLADIAEAIYLRQGQVRVLEELSFPEADQWREAQALGDHFCVHCVFARLAREGILDVSIGFNYDCGAEASLDREGFVYGDVEPGRQWRDHARVVPDGIANVELKSDGAFKLYKAHGCAVRYREQSAAGRQDDAAKDIVIRRSQLDSWHESGWSRDAFRALARNHVLLLVGFSGQEAKFSYELRNVLEDVYEDSQPQSPRVIALDRRPDATPIESLIKSGLGDSDPGDGVVTKVGIADDSSATAAMLVLLGEMLAIRLRDDLDALGVELPDELDARLGSLTVSAPLMLRWSYLVRRPGDNEWIQRANGLAKNGYVPLSTFGRETARLITARRALRERLGHPAEESSIEALSNGGFVLGHSGGVGYLPVAIDQVELATVCRSPDSLAAVRRVLRPPPPHRLDTVLVSSGGDRGVNLNTAEEVGVG